MTTGKQTTYIMLERGVEDVALVKDIRQAMEDLEILDIKTMYIRYPKLAALIRVLQRECDTF